MSVGCRKPVLGVWVRNSVSGPGWRSELLALSLTDWSQSRLFRKEELKLLDVLTTDRRQPILAETVQAQ